MMKMRPRPGRIFFLLSLREQYSLKKCEYSYTFQHQNENDLILITYVFQKKIKEILYECSTVESCGHSILGVDLFGSFFIYEELGHIFLNNTGRKFHKENQDKTSFHSVIINCTNTDFKLISTSSTTKH